MDYNYYNNYYPDYLMHYGVKGMKWGVRKAARANAQKAYKETLSSTSRIGNSHYTRVRKAKKAGQQAYKETIKSERAAAKAERNTPEAKAARKEKVIKAAKIGAAVAGTALAAYGAYKLHDFVRGKNEEIRVKEASDKCDRMLKKLDRMKVNDLVRESSATHNWVNTGKQKTPFQYNNNGKSVTIPKQYRNTQSALKSTQYRNIENKIIDKYMGAGYEQARNDSFSTAAKNVYNHYRKRKR